MIFSILFHSNSNSKGCSCIPFLGHERMWAWVALQFWVWQENPLPCAPSLVHCMCNWRVLTPKSRRRGSVCYLGGERRVGGRLWVRASHGVAEHADLGGGRDKERWDGSGHTNSWRWGLCRSWRMSRKWLTRSTSYSMSLSSSEILPRASSDSLMEGGHGGIEK